MGDKLEVRHKTDNSLKKAFYARQKAFFKVRIGFNAAIYFEKSSFFSEALTPQYSRYFYC